MPSLAIIEHCISEITKCIAAHRYAFYPKVRFNSGGHRCRAVEYLVTKAIHTHPCPEHLHEYAALVAFYTARFYPEFDCALSAIVAGIPAFASCIFQIYKEISQNQPTARKLTFFTIICFVFFKSGRLLPSIFPHVDIFKVAYSKLLLVTHLRTKQYHKFAPRSITDRQNYFQSLFTSTKVDQRKIRHIIQETLPYSHDPWPTEP